MSKDTIYREDAIKEIEECIVKENEAISEYPDDTFKYNSGLLTAIQAVHDLPSADTFEITKEALIEAIDNAETVWDVVENIINRPQGWIPCSERLPKEEGIYLVTATNCIFDTEEIVVGTCYFNIEYGFSNNRKILAWMPLPEPWKGADDDNTEMP